MKLKKTFLFVLSTICIFAFANSVSADEISCKSLYSKADYDYLVKNTNPTDLDLTCSNGTIFTDAYLSKVNSEINSLAAISTNDIEPSRYYVYKLSVPNYQQQNGYYCGPANIKQVVQYLNGSSYSQDTYASYMGTNSNDGTYVYQMTNALNNYTSKSYSYVLGNNYNTNTFATLVQNRVSNNKPIILHALTSSLALYNGTNLAHYITVNGHTLTAAFGGSSGINNIYYVDTWYQNYGSGSVLGEHMDTTSNVFNTVNYSYRYIIQ